MDIIGQIQNLWMINNWLQDRTFPRFMIITGERGMGKQTLARYIAKVGIGGYVVFPENSVEAVREAIENSYKCTAPTTYIFVNADKMSPQAKNALLKITEEPPRQAYFIMTVQDINNTLATLKSRGTEIKMEAYTYGQLEAYLNLSYRNDLKETDRGAILAIATNPGQIEELLKTNVDEFLTYCNTVLDNIGTVTGVNAFKAANRFRFKEDDAGYDPILFFNCALAICESRMMRSINELSVSEMVKLCKTMKLCSKYKSEMSITGIKKDATFDMWILDMREVLKGDN